MPDIMSADPIFPALKMSMNASSGSGGVPMDPCAWGIPDPICCPDWAGFPAAVQVAARDYAAIILWAATGRQYGLCEVTVRPCGVERCPDGSAHFWGYDWSGGTWVPYIFGGTWFNCACPTGSCSCAPHCQVRLMGHVETIIEVMVDGVVLDPKQYRVDDNHWLVRINGDCWPSNPDFNSDEPVDIFQVKYLRGEPIPTALLQAASTLACEWGKACVGGDCRLSNRVTSLARNGVTIDMVDPTSLLDNGLTGLWEVDTVIRALNPFQLTHRLRVYAPELRVPRTVTSPI